MSAREMQIGQDILRYTNIMNDLVDVASMHMKEVAEDTGEKYQEIDKFTSTMEKTVMRDASFTELKQRVQRDIQNALAYKVTLESFMSSLSDAVLGEALGKFDETVESVTADITNMAKVCAEIAPKVQKAENKIDLKSIAVDIDSKVPPLKLIRRTWCLEK